MTNEAGLEFEPHPYYGPCDALAPNGECAECRKYAGCVDQMDCDVVYRINSLRTTSAEDLYRDDAIRRDVWRYIAKSAAHGKHLNMQQAIDVAIDYFIEHYDLVEKTK